MSTLIELQERREIQEQLQADGTHTYPSAALPVHWVNSSFQLNAMESPLKDRSCQH